MPEKKKRDDKSEAPVPPCIPTIPPGFDKRPPPPPSCTEFTSLKAEMLKELHRTDQYLWGIFEMKQGNVSRGQYMMGKAINEVGPKDIKELNLVGLSFYFEGNVEEALRWFQKALGSNPDHPETINNIGLCYYSQRNYTGVITQYKLAITKKADNAIFWWNLALAQMKSNQIDATLSSLQKAFELNDKLREEAIQEETFVSLRDHPTFQRIVKTNKAWLE